MLRTLLIAIGVLFVLRWLARLAAPRAPAHAAPPPEPTPRAKVPPLSDAERAELERERERALREGRQVDAIRIHRRLAGAEPESEGLDRQDAETSWRRPMKGDRGSHSAP